MTRVAALAALALLVPHAAAQEAAAEDEVDRERLETFLDKARTGSAVIRPQAARRLVGMGDAAAERILEEAGETTSDLAQLGSELVEVMGEFDDARMREKLWEGVADPEFPWRPAAARSLALAPRATERGRFDALLADAIAPVRVAAVAAIARLAPEDERAALRPLLEDPSDRVRRAAAVRLDQLGEHGATRWLLEDLRRVDTYFERETGKGARYDSLRALAGLGVDTAGYDPELPPEGNSEALAAIEAALRERAGDGWPEALPPVARATTTRPEGLVGVELRSCRRGEHVLAWTADDRLVVGAGNGAVLALPDGTTERLLEAAAETAQELERPLYGRPGCDLEQFRFRADPTAHPRMFLVAKGYESIEGLRPDALGAFAETLVEAIPADTPADDPRTRDLRRRVAEAFAAIGGEL